MSTNATRPEKDSGRTDPRPPSILLGVDTDATSHHYSTDAELLLAVEPDGSLANVVDVDRERRARDGSVIDAYMRFVDDWVAQFYVTSFGDHIEVER